GTSPARRPSSPIDEPLFLPGPRTIHFGLAGQAEAIEFTREFLGEEGLVVAGAEQGIAGADVDAPAGDRGPRPDRADRDLLEHASGLGVEGDEPAAGDGGEIDDAVGHGEARGDRVA